MYKNPETKELKKLIEMSYVLDGNYNTMNVHKLDKFYDDRGIVVRPDYRGYGIALEFFKARRLICKEHGVTMTGAWMTAHGTQKSAQRDGWETVVTVDRDEFAKQMGVTYEPYSPTSIKYMLARIQI
ncbi:uncharacterized protein LOC142975022 [Anticarsia gemmatalis]|uniref:uncharacterized protein LOC142975022 n=1 Tax=Anticarsia gemmatalis TaxID=129554 RepID=UPI003F762263